MAEEQRKKVLIGCGVLLAIVVILAVAISTCEGGGSSTPSSPLSKSVDVSAAMQAQRYTYIQELVSEKIIMKVEKPGSLPYIWVAPRFYTATFDEKQVFINVIWTYYVADDPRATPARIFDGMTGKQIGTFDQYSGLKLD